MITININIRNIVSTLILLGFVYFIAYLFFVCTLPMIVSTVVSVVLAKLLSSLKY